MTINRIIGRLRAIIYRTRYNIGNNCNFGKIKFWDCEKESILIGNNVIIFRKTEICSKEKYPVSIGDNSFINQQCIIRPNVIIGKNVDIAPGVMLMSDTHEIGTNKRRAGTRKFSPIKIGDSCWIGANATILGGVTIGNSTIIGAGSVVTKNCESNCIYAGVPARLIKRLD